MLDRKLISVEISDIIGSYIDLERQVRLSIESGYTRDGSIFRSNGRLCQAMVLVEPSSELVEG